MSNDQRLLQDYLALGSPQALEMLIRRHLPLVYSAALRQVRDPHLAEDVTQAVFLVLSQKARTIRNGVAVGGWLLSVTRYTSVNAMKKRSIRQSHEMLAARPELVQAAASQWEDVAPRLDAELNRLGQLDRDAVVLRFFQDRSFAEIGEELGLTEEAARKRVVRALARLRGRLDRPEQAITTDALGVAIAAYAVQGVPNHLMAGTIVACIGSPTPFCVSLAKGAINMIAWTKAKLIGAVAASVVLGAAGAVMLARAAGQQQTRVVIPQQQPAAQQLVVIPQRQPDLTALNAPNEPAPAAPATQGASQTQSDASLQPARATLVVVPAGGAQTPATQPADVPAAASPR